MTFAPLGDSAVVVTLGAEIDESTLRRVQALTAALTGTAGEGVVDVVPAYASVTVFYEPAAMNAAEVSPYRRMCAWIEERAAGIVAGKEESSADEAVIEIPVCYGGDAGPDLGEVARHAGLSEGEVVEWHAAAEYRVHAVGFAPGFPYLGGLPEILRTPRRATPRVAVPAGSVGIGGAQTGIYPLSSPGGWQLIGRTPLELFRVTATPAARLRMGDRVRFRAIDREEWARWK